MATLKEKIDVYNLYTKEGFNKTQLGASFRVSPRSIGRWIDYVEEMYESQRDDEEDTDIPYEDSIDDNDTNNDVEYAILNDEVSYTYVVTPDSISITRICDDEVDTSVVDKKHASFDDVFKGILSNPHDEITIGRMFSLINKKVEIEEITEGRVRVIPEENRIEITDGDEVRSLSGKLSKRIIDAVVNKEPQTTISALMRFADRLVENPSFRAVHELYDFLKAADIKINADGMVECYKRVRDDYRDVHSATFDNSPGRTVSVHRNMVDEDSNKTCSYGLHVCSYSYLNSYGGQRVLKVLVDPKDFVAIPKDYYSYGESGSVKAKARVCSYYVESDITKTYR